MRLQWWACCTDCSTNVCEVSEAYEVCEALQVKLGRVVRQS